MGFSLRKSVRVGPLRFNLSGSGVGVSVGIRGLRIGTGPRGNYIHAGTHGLYYRTGFGSISRPEAPPQPANPTVERTIDGLQEIESASVHQMAPASAQVLLDEIRSKHRRLELWPLHASIGGIGVLLLALSDLQAWAVLASAVALLCSIVWVRTHDVLRKTVVLLYELDGPFAERYQSLHNGFDWLAQCAAVWHLEASGATGDWKHHAGATHLVKRKAVRLLKGDPPWIKTNVETPILPVGRQKLYLLPDRVLVVDRNGVGAVEYTELRVEAATSNFIEEGSVPSDAEVVGQTWKYPNKSGGPDRRFKYNPQIPKVRYGDLRLRSTSGLNEALQTSNKDAPSQFASGVAALAGSFTRPTDHPSESGLETSPPAGAAESGGPVPSSQISDEILRYVILVGIPTTLLVTGIFAYNQKRSVVAAQELAKQLSAPSPSPVRNAPGSARSGNTAHDALMALSPVPRTSALSLMVKKAGHRCAGTRHRFERLDPHSRDAFWTVVCGRGKTYSIRVPAQPTAVPTVSDCDALKRKGRDCFRP